MENNPVSCKLKIPKDLDTKTPVFLVDFSNGNLNLRHSNKLKLACYRPVDFGNGNSSSTRRILVANSGILNYEGESNESNDDHNKMNYFVGVRNKESGRMKIFDTISFHLKPIINSSLQSASTETKNFRERSEDLSLNFGSKGQKRTVVARQKYLTESASVGDVLDDISIDGSLDKAKLSDSFSNASTNIDYFPPQNCQAQTVDQVYEISDIISAEEDEHLDKETEELLEYLPTHLTQWKVDGTFCEYVINHLEADDLNYVKAKYLIYYNYLVIFSKLLSSDIKKKDPAPQIPDPIKSCLLGRFIITSPTEYGKVKSFPQKMKDKLLSYILVLALTIDDYCVNLALVQKGTKYGLPKVSTIAQALGCYILRQRVDNCAVSIAELKLPLFVLQKYKKKIIF